MCPGNSLFSLAARFYFNLESLSKASMNVSRNSTNCIRIGGYRLRDFGPERQTLQQRSNQKFGSRDRDFL